MGMALALIHVVENNPWKFDPHKIKQLYCTLLIVILQ